MLSWFSFKGVRSVVELALATVINIFVPNHMFYVRQSVGRQPFFKMDKTKKKLGGLVVGNMHAHNIFGSVGWHSSNNLSKLNHYTIRGFNAAGNLVFMAELANRVVDSEAWVYRAGEVAMTFEANKYGRVAACITRTYGCVLPSATRINYARKTSGLVPIPSAVSWGLMDICGARGIGVMFDVPVVSTINNHHVLHRNKLNGIARAAVVWEGQGFYICNFRGKFLNWNGRRGKVAAADNENVFYNGHLELRGRDIKPVYDTVRRIRRKSKSVCEKSKCYYERLQIRHRHKAAYDARAAQDSVPQCSLSPSGCSSKEPAIVNVKCITRVRKTNTLEIQTRRKYLTRQTKTLPLSNNTPLVPPILPTDIFPKLSAEAKAFQDIFNSFIQGTSIGEYAESLLRVYFKSNLKCQGQISVFVDPLQDLYEDSRSISCSRRFEREA
ncbi:hypothetical protein ARMGADRAFT_1032121 [Armillaria gallica]|uniref:Uncharacterized protein n=1 Tax=Armillaria gallica TaxID=47427 RepID=A0A2H3DPQ0_ARMGA|nr:hypothetical protein ARMGADRAFT_1032121 [Armillaria gallica]